MNTQFFMQTRNTEWELLMKEVPIIYSSEYEQIDTP